MTTRQKIAPQEANAAEDLQVRQARALELVRGWLAEDPEYDLRVFPLLKAGIEADRLSYRKRFKG
jgi:hypothetical protein